MVLSYFFFNGLSQTVVAYGFNLLRFYAIMREFVLVYKDMDHHHDYVSVKEKGQVN